MAKIALRNYNKEIERLIEQGNIDEAIGHCRHILKTFPKYLEIYRLLGKAFLEEHKYNEAIDVFGRVLMAVPDDFVAHVGLSIIRDEENKLDDAIWHMERAFESQPSNAAIQGELQRLYGRRDGMEPPKIRMTRGALAQMYVQGELYPQAIAEIRAVLAEDPQRSDMQVLLALSYFKSGQKNDASDICDQLLKRYPYCFEANRIKVEMIPANAESVESTQVYRARVGDLDPYAHFNKGSVFQINDVPTDTVTLERYEYSPDDAGDGWSAGALGDGFDASSTPALTSSASSDAQPDWLKAGGFSDESFDPVQSMSEPDSSAQSQDDIPDFLRAAGWAESSQPEQPTSMFDEEPAEDLVPADMPDWLKDQAPASDDLNRITGPRPDAFSSDDTPDWMSNLGGQDADESLAGSAEQAQSSSDTPDWLSGLGDQPTDDSSSDMPEQAQASGDVSDWLSGLDTAEEAGSQAQEPEAVNTQEFDSDTPDWLSGLGGSQSSETENDSDIQTAGDAPDWLSELGGGQDKSDEAPAQPADIPDWLSGSEPKSEPDITSSVEDLGASAQEQDDAVAWLESLAAKHGAKPEELVTDPNKRSDIAPDWVQKAQSAGEIKSDAQPAFEQEVPKDEPVSDAANIGEQFFAEFESASEEQLATDETGMWLRDLDKNENEPAPDAVETGDNVHEIEPGSLPDWITGNDLTESEPAKAATSFEDQNINDNDLSDWLSGLDDEPSLEFTDDILHGSQRPPVPAKPEKTVEPKITKTDLPDWLSDVDSESDSNVEEVDDGWKEAAGSAQTDEPAPASQQPSATLTADLPDWLQGVDDEQEQPDEAQHTALPDVDELEPDDEAPWLHRERYEAEALQSEPTPTSPSDWHPIGEAETADAQPEPEQKAKPAPSQPRKNIVDYPPKPKPSSTAASSGGKKKSGKSPRPTKAGSQADINILSQAKAELDRGDIPAGLEHYARLIKKGKYLEEIIRDLRESLKRYPVEVGIWQMLGDAYNRANRLTEALEAYNKAEEQIR